MVQESNIQYVPKKGHLSISHLKNSHVVLLISHGL